MKYEKKCKGSDAQTEFFVSLSPRKCSTLYFVNKDIVNTSKWSEKKKIYTYTSILKGLYA